MKSKEEGRDHAEVAAPAANRPEEVGVFLFTGRHEATIGEYHVRAEQVVDGEAVRTRQVADPTAQCEAGDPRAANRSARSGHAKGVRRVVHVSPYAASFHADGARGGIHAYPLHAREIDNQTIVADPEAAPVVAAPAYRGQQLVFASKLHRGRDVGRVHAACDQLRAFVDHCIVDLACRIVDSVRGLNKITAEEVSQLIDSLRWHGILSILKLWRNRQHNKSPP